MSWKENNFIWTILQTHGNANIGQCVIVHRSSMFVCILVSWQCFQITPCRCSDLYKWSFPAKAGATGLAPAFPFPLPFHPPSPARQERKCSQAQVSGIRLTLCQLTWENVRGKLKSYQMGGTNLRGSKFKREQCERQIRRMYGEKETQCKRFK